MSTQKVISYLFLSVIAVMSCSLSMAEAWGVFGKGVTELTPENKMLRIPVIAVSDGKAHFFKVKAEDGIMVVFFAVKSQDGLIRTAIDACDVCYKSGKGYTQNGDFMVCMECGMKFLTNRINEVSGGCNPAPLERVIDGAHLVIQMSDINKNSWYCKYKK